MNSLQPGQYICLLCDPEDADRVGFHLRRHNVGIRNTLNVVAPSDHFFVLLAQKHTSQTYHEQVVKRGRGVLNIDACRISLDPDDPNMRLNAKNHDHAPIDDTAYVDKGWGLDKTSDLGYHNSSGRWPTNFLLIHGEDCELEGTKKFQPKNGSGKASSNSRPLAEGDLYDHGVKKFDPDDSASYVDEDGTEKIPDWNCQPDCPVHLLDQQSGILVSKWGSQGDSKGESMFFGDHEHDASKSEDFIGDSGGASRYFKQLRNHDQLIGYLAKLIGSFERVVEW